MNLTEINKYYLLTFYLGCFISLFGQSYLSIGFYGRSPMFNMGSCEQPKLNTISIEANSVFEQALKRKIKHSEIQMKIMYDVFNFPPGATFYIPIDSNTQGDYEIEIKNEYDNSSIASKHVYGVGKLELPSRLKRKIKWLDFNPALGEENDFSEFKNLSTLTTQRIGLNGFYIAPENFYKASLILDYPGSPFFWNKISQIKNLQTLQFDIYSDHTNYGVPGNIYMLNPPKADLFKLKKIKNVHFDKFLFLPVCFREYEKLSYLSVKHISTPELVNLALVMYGAGKDTTVGYWTHFLNEVDLNKPLQIPTNGVYESFYKNGKRLCRGMYKNGEPDGVWEFWYNDGTLSQKRSYVDGERNGTWLFFAPDQIAEYKLDTITKIVYEDGNLTELEMTKLDYIGYSGVTCSPYEFSRDVKQKIEYKLNWESEFEVVIRKTLSSISIDNRYKEEVGDTLTGHTEQWEYNSDGWNYSFEEHCHGRTYGVAREKKGKPGNEAYYSSMKYFNNQKDSVHISHGIIDLEKCYHEYIEYSEDYSGKELNIIETEKKEISEDDWSCQP